MRIALFSDLHTEFDNGIPWTPPELETDVMVFAGDNVTSPTQMRAFAEAVEMRQRTATHIIYVCGNHEFYGSSVRFGGRGYEKYREALVNCPRSHVLEMDSLDVSGIRFVGATMWTPVPAQAPLGFNDYRCIRLDHRPYRKLLPSDVRDRFHKTVLFLEQSRTVAVPTIVVTHHPPSRIGLRIEDGNLWAADLDAMIAEWQPLAWLHGHVHQSHDDTIGATRIASNPRGYFPDALNPAFDRSHILTIQCDG